MRPLRSLVLLAAIAAIGWGVVALRGRQAQSASRILALDNEWIEQRRLLWRAQSEVARLRTPARIHDSLFRLRNRPEKVPTFHRYAGEQTAVAAANDE